MTSNGKDGKRSAGVAGVDTIALPSFSQRRHLVLVSTSQHELYRHELRYNLTHEHRHPNGVHRAQDSLHVQMEGGQKQFSLLFTSFLEHPNLSRDVGTFRSTKGKVHNKLYRLRFLDASYL